MTTRKRNRPDKDGKDRSKFDYYKKIIRATCSTCAICGLPINYDLKNPHPWSFTVDHIIPIALGGQTTEENLQPAHWKCNRAKGEKLYMPLEEINKLRILQGARPLLAAPPGKRFAPGQIPRNRIPEDEEEEFEVYDMNHDLPQSANWRVF